MKAFATWPLDPDVLDKLQPRVAAGVEELDSVAPNWRMMALDKIYDGWQLCLESTGSCVLGLVFDTYESGMLRLNKPLDRGSEYGFMIENGLSDSEHVYQYRALDHLWQNELKKKSHKKED